MARDGQLQVWWIPQVPGKLFTVDVSSVVEGALLLKTLAAYDTFQFENRIKPDYSNAGGLRVWEGGDWTDWMDEKTGCDNPIEFCKERA